MSKTPVRAPTQSANVSAHRLYSIGKAETISIPQTQIQNAKMLAGLGDGIVNRNSCNCITPLRICGVVISLVFAVSPAFADFSGRVVGVSDGDTIKVMHNGRAEKIRLNGIDCPEKAQPFGTKAKQFTAAMVFGKDVTVQVKDADKYGRTVADVILSDGRNLNRELVAAGLAWWYRQ